MSYRTVGGLHFVTIGRFGFCWFWKRKRIKVDMSKVSDEVYGLALDHGLKVIMNKHLGGNNA